MKNVKVLVTGGAGYIGSHVCKGLFGGGFEPIVFDNFCYGHPWSVRWSECVKGNILDTQAVYEALIRYGVQAVVHLAGYTYVGESVLNPQLYYLNNVQGTLSILSALHKAGVKHIVFSSSCAVYGIPDHMPLTEETPLCPINPYGKTKWVAEEMLRDFEKAYGITYCALRYFNAAGADEDGLIGEDHTPETHLIPLALAATQPGGRPLTVFGSNHPTPDGTCVRDYVHVEDLAQAHVLSVQALLSGQNSSVYNLSTSQGVSVRQVIKAVEQVTGRPVAWVWGEARPGDPPCLVAQAQKAYEQLGWVPRKTEIHHIIQTAWQWAKVHFNYV
jgi:UDP-arabinose 4-epimerase